MVFLKKELMLVMLYAFAVLVIVLTLLIEKFIIASVKIKDTYFTAGGGGDIIYVNRPDTSNPQPENITEVNACHCL